MLHLLPVRLVLRALVVFTILVVSAAFYLGWIAAANEAHGAIVLIRWSSAITIAAVVILHLAWRWIRPFQTLIFPYIGGRWIGTLAFGSGGITDRRDVTLEIKHTLFGLKLLLQSAESVSWTLAVHAERDRDFRWFRLYYVYLNERKEGVQSGGDRYRGLAVLRIVLENVPELHGDYFTETLRSGTLRLTLQRATDWWRLWR